MLPLDLIHDPAACQTTLYRLRLFAAHKAQTCTQETEHLSSPAKDTATVYLCYIFASMLWLRYCCDTKKPTLECRTIHNEELRDKQRRWEMINSQRVRWGDDHEHKMTISHSVKSHLEASALPCSKLSQSAMTFSFKVPRTGAVITLLECKCSLGQLEVAPIPMQGHNNPPFPWLLSAMTHAPDRNFGL